MTDTPERQRLTDEILDLFAKEARIERSRLVPELRADELGVTSLDMAMALFALEDRYDVRLAEFATGDMAPTVGQVVQQVLEAIASQPVGGGLPAAAGLGSAHP